MYIFIREIFENVFINEDVLKFFLFFIGSCLNGMDYQLFKGNIIFYGNYSIDLIELLKFSIYEVTKLYIRSLTDIKFRYNNYDLKTAKLFRVNINDFIKLKKEFKTKKEIFIIVCNYYYQKYQDKFLKANIEPVFFLNKFEKKEDLFLFYSEQCISIDKSLHFKISDIIVDFNIFLDKLKLPKNIISKKELHQLIQKNLHNCCSKKNGYNISLKNYNKQDICLRFF
jgi:Mismatch repair ATPase (MutS family)